MAGHGEQGGVKIDALHGLGADAAELGAAGPDDNGRFAGAAFVERRLAAAEGCVAGGGMPANSGTMRPGFAKGQWTPPLSEKKTKIVLSRSAAVSTASVSRPTA